MTSSISYSIEDKDLDDAALWAVIDSAEASHSCSKARKPLALKYSNSNFQSPSTSISGRSHPPRLAQNSGHHLGTNPPNLSPYRRPHKIAKPCPSEVSDSTSPLALVRTPIANTVSYKSPEAYLSPQIGRFDAKEFNNDESEVSLGSHVHRDEKHVTRHCLNTMFPSVSLFKDYQDAAIAILEKSDYTVISGNPFIKKSGWRKISFYFNISYEIRDKTIEFDESRNVQRTEFVVRAYMQGGRFSDGWGSCDRREKRFLKPNHDIPSTAETRAKNKACQDLLGIGACRPRANHSH